MQRRISSPGKSVFNDLKNPDWSSLIDVSEPAALPPVFNACSSIPDISNWPGEYSFKVSFDNQEKNKSTKHMNWTYSETDNKLYVKKDAFCPFNFSTNRIMPAGCAVRAMVVYTAPEHNSQVVTRCLNHSRPEIEQGVFEGTFDSGGK
ncbi:hypothetical protein NPIL_123401 [Nephila pilipes]|uniref:p53 DNA-binding domain-containing protein n=1 Tax=Nephila pilipes TaxID=299642 RepID=A0A8X6JGV1_NEPPI|nr:hypothetical protein NPIL_123401 [Nephila pilipes]